MRWSGFFLVVLAWFCPLVWRVVWGGSEDGWGREENFLWKGEASTRFFFLPFLITLSPRHPPSRTFNFIEPWLMMVLRLEEGNVWIWNCATGNDNRFISWSSQRAINKMPQPWSPPAENLEKKAVIPPCCGDKTTILYENVLPKKTQLPLLCSYSWIKFDKTAINLPELLYDLGCVVILHISI